MNRLIIPASHQFPLGMDAQQLSSGTMHYHRDGLGRVIAAVQLLELDDPARPGQKATFIFFATGPATSVLPIVKDSRGLITGAWFLHENRAVEGWVYKAPGNFNHVGESSGASAVRSLAKIGMVGLESALVDVYPFNGIGTQFAFGVAGFVTEGFTINESARLSSNNARVFLTFEEIVERAHVNGFFGDDINNLVMWVMSHNLKVMMRL